MKKYQYLVIVFSLILCGTAYANSGEHFEKVHIDMHNPVSLQKGAKIFVNYCMGCHSLKFVRYERMAKDFKIPEQIVIHNMMFNSDKIGETMKINMPPKDAKKFFGTTPPDLSLIARSKGIDYLYAYLTGFYKDDSRPFGVNNSAFNLVAMPDALESLQGLQKKTDEALFQEKILLDSENELNAIEAKMEQKDANMAVLDKQQQQAENAIHKASSIIAQLKHDDKYFELVHKGSMKPKEFKEAMVDLVNFLSYVAEPIKAKRISMGVWVILFLVVFFILAYLLKQEYWKDVH